MIYLATLLGYGDCLITLSLLEKARERASDIRLVGTGITQSVLGLISSPISLSMRLFDDVAAFYVIRERGLAAAGRDLAKFRAWAQKSLSRDDILLLENAIFFNPLLVPGVSAAVLQVPRTQGAYMDRELVFRPYLGVQAFEPCAAPRRPARLLLINPSARARVRRLTANTVETALCAAAAAGAQVCLVDADGSHGQFKSRVQTYLLKPPLSESAAALKNADAYVGPDSFFMHLAYYYRIPFLGFFRPSNLYFMPPGTREQGNFILYPKAQDEKILVRKLDSLLAPGAA